MYSYLRGCPISKPDESCAVLDHLECQSVHEIAIPILGFFWPSKLKICSEPSCTNSLQHEPMEIVVVDSGFSASGLVATWAG